jgi:hypothetical protein
MNNYKAAFEPIRRGHNDVPEFNPGKRKALPEGSIARSYAASTHLIDSEGQPITPMRGENNPSRRRLLVAGLAAVVLAASGAVAYVGVKASEPSTTPGPDVAPLVHHIQDNENNHDPIQNPIPVTPAEERQAAATTDNP